MSGLQHRLLQQRIALRDVLRTPRFETRSFVVAMAAIALGCLMTSILAVGIGGLYHRFMYGWNGPVDFHARVGALAGFLYAVPFLVRGDYTIPAYLSRVRRPQRIFMSWNAAFLGLLAIGFLTQTTSEFSRVTAVVFYISGLMVMIGLEAAVRSGIVKGLEQDILAPRRVMLVGPAEYTRAFNERVTRSPRHNDRIGIKVISVTNVPEHTGGDASFEFRVALERAVAKARTILPDDVVIVAPWHSSHMIDAVVGAFEQLPVAIHLDGGATISRYHDVQLRRVGSATTLSLAEVPLSPAQEFAKRAFDVVAAACGLLLAAPLFALIAIAIKLDSPGPVFFRQNRRGFNQGEFKIWKFRSMRTADNGSYIRQAKVGDPRITRVGGFLRRTSLDELPQLINVLTGDMSLVGPRPHAVAHDVDFGSRIDGYPRRLNMKPGITGWAQVNGLRGETDTDEKMQKRVQADLYYIDNWSLMFDCYIVLLTVISPRVFRNAR